MIKELLRIKAKKHIYFIFFQIIFIICFFIFIYGVNSENIFTPWIYSGDALSAYQNIQNIKDSGWVHSNPRLAAPFKYTNVDFMVISADNIGNLIIKILLLFSNNIWFSINVFYILNCFTIAIITYFVIINFKINNLIALMASLSYALLSYFFLRGISHIFLSMYQFVPLGFLLCYWLFTDDNFFKINKHFFLYKRNIIALIFCFLIANNGNGYYPVFSCFFFLITGLLKNEFKINKKMLPSILIITSITFLFIINLSPNIINRILNGKNTEVAIRHVNENEYYGLKITQLFIPTNSHQINIIKNVVSKASQGILNAEGSAFLGLFGSIGCLFLFIYLFIPIKDTFSSRLLFLLSRLNIAAILLATIGGFSLLFAYIITPQLRAFNRISIFIAFFSILTFSIILNYFDEKVNKKYKKIFNYSIIVFTIFCIFFQYPHSIKNKYLEKSDNVIKFKETYASDKEFISRIENSVPRESMIYQLPFHRYPEEPPKNKLSDYIPFIGCLNSENLKWSYGAIKGRYPDYWHQNVDSLPLDLKINILSLVGFEGILIDWRGYNNQEKSELINKLNDIINIDFIHSNNSELSYLSLNNYKKIFNSKYSNEKLIELRNDVLNDIDNFLYYEINNIIDSKYYSNKIDAVNNIGNNSFIYGNYNHEGNFYWCKDKIMALFKFNNFPNKGIRLSFALSNWWFIANKPDNFEMDIKVNGDIVQRINLNNEGIYDFTIMPYLIPNNDDNIYRIELSTNGYFIPLDVGANPADYRKLSYMLMYLGEAD